MLARSALAVALLLAFTLAGGPVAAIDDAETAAASEAVEGPLPRLGEVGPVEGAPRGLSISPAVTEVTLDPGRRVEVVHLLANASDEPLEVRLDTLATRVGEDGPSPRDGAPATSEDPVRLVAPVADLWLDAGEGAELRSTGEVSDATSGVVALRATTPAGDHVTALVVLADGSVPSGLEVAVREPEDGAGVAVVELRPGRHAVVDLRVRVRSWLGTLSDRTVADLVVAPGEPRLVAIERPAAALPGRLQVEVVAVDRAGQEVRADLTTSAGAAGWLLVVAVLLVATSIVVVALTSRRLRSGRPPNHVVEEPEP